MKSNSLRLAAAFMLAALTTLALAQGFTLKRAAKAGDTAKYRLKADIDVAGTSATFTAVLTEKILRVEDNGNYVVESNQTEGKVIFSGTEMPAPAQSPTVTIYRPTGEVAEIRGEVQDSSIYRIANLGLLRLPEKEMKTGETWNHELKGDPKTGAVAVKATYTIVGPEKIGEHETVKVKFDVSETEGAEKASAAGHVWIDTKTGLMVQQEAEWKNAPFPGAPGPISAKIHIVKI